VGCGAGGRDREEGMGDNGIVEKEENKEAG
jgi:hypothetical protein